MDTNSTSQKKNESEGQTGCEACIKKDEIITDLYEALKDSLKYVIKVYADSDSQASKEVLLKAQQALAKAER